MPDSELNDLLGRACAGDFGALEQLLLHFRPELAGYLERRIGVVRTFIDVDDILQESLIDVFRRIRSFENQGIPGFRSWLFKSVRSNLVDAIRTAQRYHQEIDESSVSDGAEVLDKSVSGGGTPSAMVRDKERQEVVTARLAAALNKLPPERATVVRLRDLEGLRFADIAPKMGRSIGWVHLAYCRAHDQLKELKPMLGNASSLFNPT